VYDNLPYFDKIAQEGISFTNYINNGCTSDTAHISLLRGIESIHTASYTGFQTYLESLPEFLHTYGYTTTFLSSVSLDFLNQRKFLEEMQFDQIIGEEAFS
jgi:phosphoglycerol transferase MdoB-like AlkP superfamily enzyme